MRSSASVSKSRATEFWKLRRPKHLFTGLIRCGCCGGSMQAVGKDYLACGKARNEAGCDNRQSVKRNRIEEAVLEGLKTHLMAPELVEEFIRAFHEELNRHRATDDMRREEDVHELGRVSKKLRGLYDAIADGLRTPGLQQELLALEDRQAALKKAMEDTPPPAPRFHPRLADHYRELVSELHLALNDPDARTEAAEILRTLVSRIEVRSDGAGTVVTVTGDIVKLLTAPGGQVPAVFESSVKVVAGARNRHCCSMHSPVSCGSTFHAFGDINDTPLGSWGRTFIPASAADHKNGLRRPMGRNAISIRKSMRAKNAGLTGLILRCSTQLISGEADDCHELLTVLFEPHIIPINCNLAGAYP